jgi:hypothetical protein
MIPARSWGHALPMDALMKRSTLSVLVVTVRPLRSQQRADSALARSSCSPMTTSARRPRSPDASRSFTGRTSYLKRVAGAH